MALAQFGPQGRGEVLVQTSYVGYLLLDRRGCGEVRELGKEDLAPRTVGDPRRTTITACARRDYEPGGPTVGERGV